MMRRLQQLANSSLAAVLVLTALNLAICRPLFQIEYIDHFNSIEGAFIAIPRYIASHWDGFSWFPLWQCGMPFQNTYVPMLHLVVAIAATLGKVSAARAYHIVVAVTYSLGPATLYLMAVRLGAHRVAAFLSALFYSLLAPSTLLMPDVAQEAGGLWLYRRLQVLTLYGEGPHISTMTLAPLAILALENTLTRRTGRTLAVAAMAIALVFLTNVPGSGALGLTMFCWICAQAADKRRAAWMAAASAAVFAYGLACYGVPPSALSTVAGNFGSIHPAFIGGFRYAAVLFVVLLAVVASAGYLLARTRLPLDVRFAILFFGLMAAIVLTASPRFELLPQARRMHLEMEMGACLLLGGLAWKIHGWIPRWVRPVVWALCLGPIGLQFDHYRSAAQDDIRNVDLAKRSEYTTARWLDANLKGRRVYAAGSTAFWLDLFSDSPQLMGCCRMGQSMPVLTWVQYLINEGLSPLETQAVGPWLRALGVEAMVINGPGSTDVYRDIKKPERFAGLFPVLHQENGDTIYSVWRGPHSLAHVVRPDEPIPALPGHRMEYAEVVRYAEAVASDSRPAASFEWLRSGAARIRTKLQRDDLVSVQVPWFSGWKALVGGQRRQISADGLGFMAIQPDCQGDCEISLIWTGRADQPFAAAVSIVSLAAVLMLVWRNRPIPDGIMKRMIRSR